MLTLVHETDSTLRLRFEDGGQTLHVDSTSLPDFSLLEWEPLTLGTGGVGCPDLPTLSTLVRLPKGSSLEVTDVEAASALWPATVGKPLAPVREGWFKDQPEPDYRPDPKVYSAPYRGGERVEVVNLGVMGTEQLFRVTVRPVCYHPVEGLLIYDSLVSAEFRVRSAELSGCGSINSELRTLNSELSELFLIVSRPQFREGLQPFVRWKRQEGYEVRELYADTHKRDSIKAMVSAECGVPSAEFWPRYMLLVGDVAQLQAYLGTTHPEGLSNHVTDLYYGEFTGDYLPDAFVGRWPVNDTAELNAVVGKTLAYEQFLNIDTAQLQRVLLVAGAENQTPAPVTTNGQVNYVSREVRQAHPFLDTVCYRNPASANQRDAILGDLRQGAAWLNYTAHCTQAGWTSPAVTFTSLDTLGNSQPLVYVNNCCLSNAFDGTCFGEQLIRKAAGGAVGVVGATNSTLWNEDYYWAVGPKYPFSLTPAYDAARPGAFDRWMGQSGGVATLGELVAAGNLAVTAFGSPYDKFYWETYCLLGDPTLRPWVGVPQTVQIHAVNTLLDGAGSLSLSGTPGVTVTVMQHDTVLGRGTIGTDGLVTLELSLSLDTTPLVVTASGHGFRPRVDTLAVEAVTGIGAAFREVTVTDSVVLCRVENIGTMPLYGLSVSLSQPGVDSTADALVAGQVVTIDTLLPHQGHDCVLPVVVTALGQQPLWRAQLRASDSTGGVLCSLMLSHTIDIAYPSLTLRLLEADGRAAHRLSPRHEYLLEAIVDGGSAPVTPDVALTVTALPTGDTLSELQSPISELRTPISTPDTLTHLHLKGTLTFDNYRSDYDWYMVGGEQLESFEAGFASYPWRQGGTRPWLPDSIVSHSGRFSVRSGPIEYRQTSDLCLDVLLAQPDTLSFWVNTSCESNYDKLVLMVDGVQRGNAMWGIRSWRRYETLLAAGRHTLCWRYVKDESGSEGEDCVWIDDVRLPLALWDSAYGWFSNEPLSTPNSELRTLKVYPNPSTGTVTVEGMENGTLQVFDLYGREVYSELRTIGRTREYAPTTNPELHLEFLPDGLYLLRAVTAVGSLHQTLVIRH